MIERKLAEADECYKPWELVALVTHNELKMAFEKWEPTTEPDVDNAEYVVSKLYAKLNAMRKMPQSSSSSLSGYRPTSTRCSLRCTRS